MKTYTFGHTKEAKERKKILDKTCEITGLSIKEVDKLLNKYTHSEIRTGKTLDEVMDIKRKKKIDCIKLHSDILLS